MMIYLVEHTYSCMVYSNHLSTLITIDTSKLHVSSVKVVNLKYLSKNILGRDVLCSLLVRISV